tara:strand:+ start:299 stop:526 length:228 start_codon:yes stop_codon:yes gene_type:complete
MVDFTAQVRALLAAFLWMDHSNYYIFSWFSPMTGGFNPRGGADHCLGGRKKKQNPSSKFYKSTTQQIFTQTKLFI